jgi:hypothetical protein
MIVSQWAKLQEHRIKKIERGHKQKRIFGVYQSCVFCHAAMPCKIIFAKYGERGI